MSDRLSELRRQRALVAEHLAWLDREIAATGGVSAVTSAPSPAPTPVARTPATSVVADTVTAPVPLAPEPPATVAAAEAILDEYRVQPDTLKTDVRKGCILYFVAALALVIVGVVILYFVLSY